MSEDVSIDYKKEAQSVEKKIRDHIRITPLEHSPYLSQLCECNVYLKLENLQLSGSFKLRGAINKLLSLTPEEKKKGIVVASSGNHGIAFAFLFKEFGIKGSVYFPENGSKSKIEVLRLYGADIKFYGTDMEKTEAYAREQAARNGQLFISPYNDVQMINGLSTIGLEIEKQTNFSIDSVLVPVGGGGLISGIGGYLKLVDPKIDIIGCQPENSPVMYESIKAGRIIEMEYKPTLSDGTVGGIEKGSITFDICKNVVDDFALVSEKEIGKSIRLMLEKHFMLVEGAAALSVAALIKKKKKFYGKNVILVISGNKSVLEKLKEIIL